MNVRPRFSALVIALSVLFALSLIVRVYPVWSLHFDGLYGQDPYAYYDYGRQIQALFTHGSGLGYFYYPLGYPALIGGGFTLFGSDVSVAQALSVISGALVCLGGLLLCREMARALGFTARAAWLSGIGAWAILTVCGQLIQSSTVIMSDASALAWATWSAWALAVYGRTQRAAWIGLAAGLLACAAMTRWQYAALGAIWALYCLAIWRTTGTIRWRHALLAVIVGGLTFAPQLIYSRSSGNLAAQPISPESWSPANLFARDFVTADGTAHYDDVTAVYYLKPFTSPYYLSMFFWPALLMGLFALRRKRSGLLLIGGWLGLQYGFLAGLPVQNLRYGLAFFAPIAILAGLGIGWLVQLSARWPNGRRLTLAVLVAAIGGYALLDTLDNAAGLMLNFVGNKDRELATVRWIEGLIPESDAHVYGLDLTLTIGHYSTLRPVQVFYETPQTIAVRLPADRPAYALFNLTTTEGQWRGKIPWQVYHWLRDTPGLTEMGTYGAFTLYRVNP